MTHYAENKWDLRIHLKQRRASISLERKREAAQLLLESFLPSLSTFNTVLSFHSLPQEINTSFLNGELAKEKRLLLPKITGDSLLIYQVCNIDSELEINSWNLWEPNPKLCPLIEPETMDCILVPGLGFDKKGTRIGYGKGHYDRLLGPFRKSLSQGRAAPKIKLIGLGFKEQLIEDGLPFEAHDVALDELVLL